MPLLDVNAAVEECYSDSCGLPTPLAQAVLYNVSILFYTMCQCPTAKLHFKAYINLSAPWLHGTKQDLLLT